MAKKKGRSLFTIFLLILNIFFILCLLVSYLAPYVSPGKIWIIAFFGLAYPVWLIINLFFALIWLLLWKRYFWLPVLAILAGTTFLLSNFQFRNKVTPPAGSLKFISYNVHSLYGISHDKEKKRKKTRPEVTTFIASEKPDFACIQEFSIKWYDSLNVVDKFAQQVHLPYYTYKNYYNIKDNKGINAIATFSRFPILKTGSLRITNLNVFAVYSDHLVGKDTVRIYNLHLKSINLGDDDYSFYANLTEAENKIPEGSAGRFFRIIYKLKRAFELRAKQVDILTEHIQASPYPVIICGDFNDSPVSYTYHQLSSGLNDAFEKAGNGILGTTYAGRFPSFRIDYILFGDSFRAFSYKKYDTDLSDHYPISVYLLY